jgi:AraC family transcriptional regulator
MPNRPILSTSSALPELREIAPSQRPIYWILQGEFGRAIVSVLSRALVAHAHAQFNMIIKLGGADAWFCTPDSTLELNDHTVILFNPWESHAKLENKDEHNPSMHLVLQIEPGWLASVLDIGAAPMQRLFQTSCVTITENVQACARRVSAAIVQSMTAIDMCCDTMMNELIEALVRDFGSVSVAPSLRIDRRPIDHRIRHALNHIRLQAAANPNMDQIAIDVGLSRSHFYQQFKRCVGVSPQHYLDWQRMTLATQALNGSEKSVAEIARDLNFSAPGHFTRFFVQHMGLSPSEFRRFTIST